MQGEAIVLYHSSVSLSVHNDLLGCLDLKVTATNKNK